ncbi:MAG TPA: DUF2079 domain-containing protein [Isosphaeraceae bacterium]|jgi:uncharacterized membrane protein|nr:DUF2079 domain-containing protein [Isosphaeraceae bacterium]
MKRLGPWLVVLLLMLALTSLTTYQALVRYRDLASGWSWDLAFNNQWFWTILNSDGLLTARPISSYGIEGPSVWKMNHLGPVRLLILPIYALWPDPRTLLVIQNVVFWWVIPAAFGLARAESRSTAVALASTALVPATPLLWPLVWNDFRELQLGLPFVLWAVHGYRSRNVGLTALGIGGMLACRQEFALVTASLALVPARKREDIGRSYRWAQAVLILGLCWQFLVFFGYLNLFMASNAPQLYMDQFTGPKAPISQTLFTSADFLLIGLGSWAILACFAPRVGILSLPWVWSLASGRWALRYVATEQWHHVRYTLPYVAVGLAAGIVGFAQLANWLRRMVGTRSRWMLVIVWILAAAGFAWSNLKLERRFAQVEPVISRQEAPEIWRWIDRVEPEDGVLAAYEVSAPLSSRRHLYSYVLEVNRPKGFPSQIPPRIRWVFLRNTAMPLQILRDQGFVPVYEGKTLTIFYRESNISVPSPKKI